MEGNRRSFKLVKPSHRYRYLWGFGVLLTTFAIGCLSSNQLSVAVSNSSLDDVPAISDSAADLEFEPASVPLDDSRESGFDGWYVLEDANGLRRSELFQLGVAFEDNDSESPAKVTGYAGVFSPFDEIGDSGYIESSWAEVETRKAKFKTKVINGFVYSFNGTFFNNKTTGDDGEKLLRGTFKTLKKGKLVKEATGDFSYYEPQCWH